MYTDCGETHPNSRMITIAHDPSEDELWACAEACNVDTGMIDTVSPTHEEQQRRMECHLGTGSYVETMVFHFEQKPDDEQKRSLMTAFEAVRSRNCLLRTRLVKYKGQVLQVVLSDKAVWTEGADLSAYKSRNRKIRMKYGKPLCRYAWLEDKNKPTYFVWTVNYSCLSFGMRNLVLDDLHLACGDFAYFMRPLQDKGVYWAGDLPRRQDKTFKMIDSTTSRFKSLGYPHITGGGAYEMLHPPAQTPYSETELSVVAHAAWALACHQDRRTPEFELISVNPASHCHLRHFQNMKSPMAEGVQVWVLIERSKQIRELLRNLRNGHDCILGIEHGARKAIDADILFYSMLFRGDLQCDPSSVGYYNRTFALIEPGGAPALFRYVGAESIPPSHDYSLLLNIHKVGDLIEIQCTWDTLMGKAQVDQMFERFIYFFEAIVNGRGDTVGDLLADYCIDLAPRCAFSLCDTSGGNI